MIYTVLLYDSLTKIFLSYLGFEIIKLARTLNKILFMANIITNTIWSEF